MMDPLIKLQSACHKFFPKVVSFFKLFKNLSFLWHHPFALLFFLSLFTSPMQPILRFFSPLIVCTLLSMVAYISFEFLSDKTKVSKAHKQIEEGLDVLGLAEDWASNHVIQPHLFKQEEEGDAAVFLAEPEELEIAVVMRAKDETFDVDHGEEGEDSDVGSNPSTEVDGVSLNESKSDNDEEGEDGDAESSPRTGVDLAPLKDSKIDDETEDEDDLFLVDGLGRQKDGKFDKTFAGFQPDVSLKQEGSSLGSLAEPAGQREREIATELENDTAGVDGREHEDEHSQSDVVDEPSESEDGLHPNTDSEQEEDDFSFCTEEMRKREDHSQGEALTICLGKEAHASFSFTEEKSKEIEVGSGLGIADSPHQEPQNDSNPKLEDNPEKETETQSQKEIGRVDDLLDHDQISAAEPQFNSDGNLMQDAESTHDSDNSLCVQGMNSCIEILDLNHDKADKLHSVCQSDSRPDISIEADVLKKSSGTVVFDQVEDLNPKSNLICQKWTNWVRGVGTDGLFFWTLEKDPENVVNPEQLSTTFDEDIRGITTMDEDCPCNGAFITMDEGEDVPTKELGAFVQQLTTKLPSCDENEAKAGKTTGKDEVANQTNTEDACVTDSEFYNANAQVQIHDDSTAEEGDGSSRWDRALDSSEKESADSENEGSEGRIWPLPLPSNISDIGSAITEQVLDSLKERFKALEKEYKSLQDEINVGYGEEKAGSGKVDERFDEGLDPYVTLFAESASDIEESYHAEDQTLAFPSETSAIIEKNPKEITSRDRPTLNMKAVLKKSGLNRIGRAIRAIGKKRL